MPAGVAIFQDVPDVGGRPPGKKRKLPTGAAIIREDVFSNLSVREAASRRDEPIQPFDYAQGREPVERLDPHGEERASR